MPRVGGPGGPRPHLAGDDLAALKAWQRRQDRALAPPHDVPQPGHTIDHEPNTTHTETIAFQLPQSLPPYMRRMSASEWQLTRAGRYDFQAFARLEIDGAPNLLTAVVEVVGPYLPTVAVGWHRGTSPSWLSWRVQIPGHTGTTYSSTLIITCDDPITCTLTQAVVDIYRLGD